MKDKFNPVPNLPFLLLKETTLNSFIWRLPENTSFFCVLLLQKKKKKELYCTYFSVTSISYLTTWCFSMSIYVALPYSFALHPIIKIYHALTIIQMAMVNHYPNDCLLIFCYYPGLPWTFCQVILQYPLKALKKEIVVNS